MIKMTRVVVSGGFDPLHIGHLNLLKDAKKLGDELIVILNTDEWLINKKGYCFMEFSERKEILESFSFVNQVISSQHNSKEITDRSVVRALNNFSVNEHIDVFANGGDRINTNTPEVEWCVEHGVMLAFNVGGGKIKSSSKTVSRAIKQMEEKKHE